MRKKLYPIVVGIACVAGAAYGADDQDFSPMGDLHAPATGLPAAIRVRESGLGDGGEAAALAAAAHVALAIDLAALAALHAVSPLAPAPVAKVSGRKRKSPESDIPANAVLESGSGSGSGAGTAQGAGDTASTDEAEDAQPAKKPRIAEEKLCGLCQTPSRGGKHWSSKRHKEILKKYNELHTSLATVQPRYAIRTCAQCATEKYICSAQGCGFEMVTDKQKWNHYHNKHQCSRVDVLTLNQENETSLCWNCFGKEYQKKSGASADPGVGLGSGAGADSREDKLLKVRQTLEAVGPSGPVQGQYVCKVCRAAKQKTCFASRDDFDSHMPGKNHTQAVMYLKRLVVRLDSGVGSGSGAGTAQEDEGGDVMDESQ